MIFNKYHLRSELDRGSHHLNVISLRRAKHWVTLLSYIKFYGLLATLGLYHLHLTNLSDLKFMLNLKTIIVHFLIWKKKKVHVPPCNINVCHCMISVTIFIHLMSGVSNYCYFLKWVLYCFMYDSVFLFTLFLVSIPIKYLQITI